MSELNGIIAEIAKRCEANVLEGETYIGTDGLLYCVKCKTPRQVVINDYCLPCMCDCQAEEYRQEQQEKAFIQAQRTIEENKKRAFPPKSLYHLWTFTNDKGTNPEVMKAAKNYADNFSEFRRQHIGLLFYGEKGTGKTYAAACIANELLERGASVIMTNFSRISNDMQSSFHGKNDYIDDICSVDLLIIDDYQAERETEYMREVVFTIIDARYSTGLPLVVTTNMSAEDFKAYDTDRNTARVISRLLEMCHPVEVKGEDLRKQKLKSKYKEINKILFEPVQKSSFDIEELERLTAEKYKGL